MSKGKNKLTASGVLEAVRGIISSNYFPFITAAFTLLCYYAGWDMVIIWYMALCGMFILLFCKDSTPLITLFLFMNIMISMKNTPTLAGLDSGFEPSDYYSQPVHLVQIIIAIVLFGGSGVYRLIREVAGRRFKASPTLFGLMLFSAGVMFNGMLSSGYNPMNIVYAIFLALLFLVIFCVCSCTVKVTSQTYKNIAWACVALSVCMVIELGVAYLTYENVIERILSGHRADTLFFGWGVHNTMGMLLVISLPSTAYLAVTTKKHSWVFTLLLMVFAVAILGTVSRQAMLIGGIMGVVCAVWILLKAPGRIVNLCIFGVVLAGVAVVAAVKWNFVSSLLGSLIQNFFFGSGRSTLYEEGMRAFLSNPLFGTGFFGGDLEGDPGFVGVSVVPEMYHNTIVQLAAAGGLFALVPYIIHRVHTVISFIKNPTQSRTLVALTIAALLLLSLLDNHIFYILPTLVYSYLVAVLINSEKEGVEG